MATLHGVIVYEIIEGAGQLVLNGIYADTGTLTLGVCELYNDIAKKPLLNNGTDELIGKYAVMYTDSDDKMYKGDLYINPHKEVYVLEWKIGNKKKFTGIGIRVGNHLSVSYIDFT